EGLTIIADGAEPATGSAAAQGAPSSTATASAKVSAKARTSAKATAASGTAPLTKAAPGKESGPLATAVLEELTVKGRAARTGYSRTLFGDGWADEDGDGCSTREEILQRDLTKTTRTRSGRCDIIVSGVLADPYSGRTINFRRGEATSSVVQIDH